MTLDFCHSPLSLLANNPCRCFSHKVCSTLKITQKEHPLGENFSPCIMPSFISSTPVLRLIICFPVHQHSKFAFLGNLSPIKSCKKFPNIKWRPNREEFRLNVYHYSLIIREVAFLEGLLQLYYDFGFMVMLAYVILLTATRSLLCAS